MSHSKSIASHYTRLANRIWSKYRIMGRFCSYADYRSSWDGSRSIGEYVYRLAEGESGSYGDFIDVDSADNVAELLQEGKAIYLMPNYLSYGDYDNSCAVERSNYRVFMAKFAGESYDSLGQTIAGCENPLSGIFQVYGGHGTTAVVIDATKLVLPEYAELVETLESLESYCVLDDGDNSGLEIHLQNEAWDSWAADDLCRELGKVYGDEIGDYLKDSNRSEFAEWFREMADQASLYWEIGAGGSAHFPIERLVRGNDRWDKELGKRVYDGKSVIDISAIASLVRDIRKALVAEGSADDKRIFATLCESGLVGITLEDSLRAGNCAFGTKQFAEDNGQDVNSLSVLDARIALRAGGDKGKRAAWSAFQRLTTVCI